MSDNDKISFEQEDDFHRQATAEKMIDLLLSEADISPMVIDGQWGTGKTTFCKKSINLIEKRMNEADVANEKVKCSYIDAFTADHANQPLITMIAAISKLIDTNEPAVKKEFLKKARGVAKFGLKTILKAGTSWIFKTNAEVLGQEFSEALSNASDEGINYAIDSIIQEHEEAEQNIQILREALSEITKEHKLIIFIDELDRCRPDFAVAILESIKHIFDVEKIRFVLVANYTQIKASINHCYGRDVDAQRYLDKFIKFSFTLPHEVTKKNNSLAAIEHAKLLLDRSKILQSSRLKVQYYLSFLNELISNNSLSLREVETFIRYMEIHYTLSNGKAINGYADIYALLYILTVFIFIFKTELRDSLEKKQVSPDKLTSLVGINEYQSCINKQYPSSTQIITALIHIAMNQQAKNYKQDDLDFWKKHFNGFFQDDTKAHAELHSFFTEEFRKLRLQF